MLLPGYTIEKLHFSGAFRKPIALDGINQRICYRVFTGNPGPRPEKMLDKISCPVLVAWGEQDPWTPLNGSVGKFFQLQVAKRDNLNLVTLPETGDFFRQSFNLV